MKNTKMNHLSARFLLALLTSPIVIAIVLPSGHAQKEQQPISQCPVITVDCPSNCPKANENIIFRAKIRGSDPNLAPKFNWSIFNGKIISGQGTSALTVTIDNHCDSMTVTVDVDGLPAGCPSRAACTTVTDCCGTALARKFDAYDDINCEDEMAHLDMFAVQLKNEPGAQGYVVFYGGRSYRGRQARRGESEARAHRIKTYLVENRGIEEGRIVMINGGYREKWNAELWVAPFGAQAPTPTPTLGIKDMKFRRGKIRKGEYNCGL
jgi:hypothetical protein